MVTDRWLDEAEELPQNPPATGAAIDDRKAAIIAAAKLEVRRAYRRRRLRRAIAASCLLACAAAAWYWSAAPGERSDAAIGLSIIGGTPLLLAFMQRRRSDRDFPLYKRLNGTAFLGVALGLSSSFGLNVYLVRLIFILLTGVHGLGAVIYLGLAIILPLHPDDDVPGWWRVIARWFRRGSE